MLIDKDINRPDGRLDAMSAAYVIPHMLFPDDPDSLKDAGCLAVAEWAIDCAKEEDDEICSVHTSVLENLLEGEIIPKRREKAKDQRDRGLVVGDVFLRTLVMWNSDARSASLNNSIKQRLSDKSVPGKSTILSFWKPFRKVAHLWAADVEISRLLSRNGCPASGGAIDQMDALLGLASIYRYWAISFIPLRGKHPFLDPMETLQLPDSVRLDFAFNSDYLIPEGMDVQPPADTTRSH